MARGRGISGRAVSRKGDSCGAVGIVFHKAFSGSTTAWTVVDALEFPVRVMQVFGLCSASNGGGTVQVLNGSNALSDAMACAVVDTPFIGGSLDYTYARVAKGGSLKLTTANSAAGDVYIICVRDDG